MELAFTAEGTLPPGDYVLSLEELSRSLLVHGPETQIEYPHWDSAWRRKLVENLGVLVRELWQVGVTEIFVNGSFVEDKVIPTILMDTLSAICDRLLRAPCNGS